MITTYVWSRCRGEQLPVGRGGSPLQLRRRLDPFAPGKVARVVPAGDPSPNPSRHESREGKAGKGLWFGERGMSTVECWE